jgi:hypothetical protein
MQFPERLRVVAFNVGGGWCRNVSEDVAIEVAERADAAGQDGHIGVHRSAQRA